MLNHVSLGIHPNHASFDPESALSKLKSSADWVALRYVNEKNHSRSFKNGKSESHSVSFDRGVMIEVFVNGYFGYAGTSDLSNAGLMRALLKAKEVATLASQRGISEFTLDQRPVARGEYQSPFFQNLDGTSLNEFCDTLRLATERMKASDKIVSTRADARIIETHQVYVSSHGTHVDQKYLMIATDFKATAKEGSETQSRSDKGGLARCNQMGLEALDRREVLARCEQIGREALELLTAPNCPTDTRDLILAPDHMLIQIHESIGHPLEIDRILGDERNYAGWSFVKPSDFGKLQYGSKLMNVTFDPSVPGEFASYAFDDCGNPATREYLIKDGLLVRGLGSLESQKRSGIPGVANFRSASWNRAPIDRMANVNLEPGSSSLAEMIAQTEKGIYVQSNQSWSIDDYRNKFQFGAEYAQLIENGKLTTVVKNPNYRGITVPFWNSLIAVGNAADVEMYGSPYCGKGEPSQIIRVGHSSPHCLFSQIEIFGGGH
ncbi:MAG: TldD/PmbA family protein [Proteobacteria bacterium]|jgi:predicted Zn-dependent protease|nr:TldD/PmbA family protein [Pseudomonadota bacterium]